MDAWLDLNEAERSKARIKGFREKAMNLSGVDLDTYQAYRQDPLTPVIGNGDAACRLCLFGRDPGREEIRHQTPFIGPGGQKVRSVLYESFHCQPMPNFQASQMVGCYVFWANTVPYKPIGNKAWSQAVKRRFFPLMADLLIHDWLGLDVITLGREAFLWFGLGLDREGRGDLEAYWRSEDRFTSHFQARLASLDGTSRRLRLHPLPHPSPLNSTWFSRFPDMLRNRLSQLAWSSDNWRIETGRSKRLA